MTYFDNELNKIEMSGGQVKLQLKTSENKTNWINLTSDRFAAVQELLLSIEEPEEQEQRVVFRYFPHDGAVIALFPDQYNKRTGDIMSYMELGQHAETAPDFGDTKAAEPWRYAAILAELHVQGYTNLNIVKRITIRKNQL
jgi:hypothetical protein